MYIRVFKARESLKQVVVEHLTRYPIKTARDDFNKRGSCDPVFCLLSPSHTTPASDTTVLLKTLQNNFSSSAAGTGGRKWRASCRGLPDLSFEGGDIDIDESIY